MPKLLNWLNHNLLTFIAGFLLIFIPLYPKWPLFDVLPGYNVRVRLEDILILGTNAYFLVLVLRRKIKLSQAPLLKSISLYLLIGLLSCFSAIFITKTIYPEWIQIAKVFLHWFRRIEYFSLFLFSFCFKVAPPDLKIYLYLINGYFWGFALWFWPKISLLAGLFHYEPRIFQRHCFVFNRTCPGFIYFRRPL